MKRWPHPVVVLSDVDVHNKVKVAMISNHHAEGVPKKPAADYASFHHTDPTRAGSISVGMPKTVHISKLKRPAFPPMNVEPDKLQLLISHTSACILELPSRGINFSLSDENCPPDQRLSRRNVGGHMSRCKTHPTKGKK